MKHIFHCPKRILAFLVALIMGMGTVFAYDFSAVCETGQTLYYSVASSWDHTCEVTYPAFDWEGYDKPVGGVVIPGFVIYNETTYQVIRVGYWAFWGCEGITSVAFSNQLQSISSESFADCTNLASISIPSSVTSIAGNPFAGTAWYNNQPNGCLCLDGCCLGYKGEPSGSLVVPSGVRLLASGAFSGCTGFDGTLSLPSSLTSIPVNAFSDCTGLTGSIVIPNAVVSIGNSAFSGCNHITGLVLGDALVSIGDRAFSGCSKLTDPLTFPSTLVSVGKYAFEGCKKLTGALVFPENIGSIGLMAFVGCWMISAVTIPNPSVSLGDYAFQDCSGLVSADLACRTISEDCFSRCYNLSYVSLQNTVSIDDGAFSDCGALTNITFPTSLVTIGMAAFHSSGLTSIDIPNSVKYIESGAFRYTTWYNNQPDGVLYVGDCCLGVKNEDGSGKPTGTLTIEEDTRLIAYYAFSDCDGLTSVIFPASLKYINGSAFKNCSSLASITSYAFAPPYLQGNPFTGVSNTIPVYVPSVSVSTYTSDAGWSYFTNYIGLATNSYEITVVVNPAAGGTVSGSGYYYANTTCTLIATSNPGYNFLYWLKNGNQVSTNPTYSFTVTANANIEAVFELQSFTITASASPSEWGSISGHGSYYYGDNCILTAQANAGYSFSNWTENGIVVSNYANYCFTVNHNRSLVANFVVSSSDSHDFVDLGLPRGTLWATCNVGAEVPEVYGDYFAWGETYPKDSYDWSNYRYCDGSSWTLTKYCNKSNYGNNGYTDELTVLLPMDDAATANWGSDWCMPTQEDWEELFNNTTNYWTTLNGVNGRLFTAENGNSIFLPSAGFFDESSVGIGYYGYYWSSTLYSTVPSRAYYLESLSGQCEMGKKYRYYGFPVRPVRAPEPITQSQTISLAAGANYVSFNVETTLADLQTALTDALGTTGVTMSIKSQTEYTELKRGHWTTGFNNFNVAQMFIINVSSACEITLTGFPIDPTAHPVTITHGANWIAYPLSMPMTITNVFTGFVGTNDALTSQTEYSKYTRGKWSTEIELQPGQGYIYGSAAMGDRTFAFPMP